MKKNYIYAIFIVFLVIFSFSCRTKEKPQTVSNQLIVGLSQIGNESSWRMCNTRSIIDAAERAGIQLIVDDAQQKQSNQIKAIRSFIVYKVDVILLIPIVETGWDSVLKEAKNANIPVIIVDRKIVTTDRSLYKCFIGENGFEEGKKAGEFIIKKYENQNRKINILELNGTEKSSISKERNAGFKSVISKDSRFSIIFIEDGDFLKSRGKEIISQIISYNNKSLRIGSKSIDIIFSQNDAMTLGALEALDSYQIQPGKDVTIVSIDGEQQAINNLKEGKINCIVECNPYMGDKLMELVKKVVSNDSIPECTYIEGTVFTENDDLLSLKPRGY